MLVCTSHLPGESKIGAYVSSCHTSNLQGLAGVGGGPRQQTQQGFESQIGTNHFGHFLLTQCLLSRLTQQVTKFALIFLRVKSYHAIYA